MSNRRDFLKTGGLAVGSIALEAALRKANAATLRPPASPPDPVVDAATKDLMMEALNAAKLGGASFADVRIYRYLQNFIQTREQQIVNVVDTDSIGCGVRVLVNGTWGFAATRDLTKASVAVAARDALAIAKANQVAKDRSVVLAPAPSLGEVSLKSSFTTDPWSVPVEQ